MLSEDQYDPGAALCVRTLTLNRPVDMPTINVFAIRERVIIKDYKGNCCLVRSFVKGQARIVGWINV